LKFSVGKITLGLSLYRGGQNQSILSAAEMEEAIGLGQQLSGRYFLNLNSARMSPGIGVGPQNPTRKILAEVSKITDSGRLEFDEAKFASMYNSMKRNRVGQKIGDLGIRAQRIQNFPVWSYVPPWDSGCASEKFADYPKKVKRNRALNGLQIEVDDPQLIMVFDAENSGASHAEQFSKLFSSIFAHGYDPDWENNDPLSASILVDSKSWCWRLDSGHHRVLTAAALGLTELPVFVTRVVASDTARFWPGVLNGDYSEDQAIHHLNDVIAGRIG
jgi:hypothetical protein